jgi:hypothetical protein
VAKYSPIAIVLSMLLAIPCYADPDFYLVMDSCKMTVAALHINKEGVKITEGDTYIMACERHSKNITCTTTFKDIKTSENNVTRTYFVKMDYPTMLVITDENHTDYIATDPTKGGAVVITRVINETIAGSKICQGIYMTSSEMKDFMRINKK